MVLEPGRCAEASKCEAVDLDSGRYGVEAAKLELGSAWDIKSRTADSNKGDRGSACYEGLSVQL